MFLITEKRFLLKEKNWFFLLAETDKFLTTEINLLIMADKFVGPVCSASSYGTTGHLFLFVLFFFKNE